MDPPFRECHGFMNLHRLRLWDNTGMGMGWQMATPEKTMPIDEHAWHLTHGNHINCTTFVQVPSLFDFPLSLLPQANHFFYVPITSSVNYTPHGINQCPAITYQEVLFVHKIGTLHTQYSLTQPQLPGVQLQQLPSISISFPELIFSSIAHIKSHGTHLRQFSGHHQFSSSIMEQPSEKLRQPLLPASSLIALIRPVDLGARQGNKGSSISRKKKQLIVLPRQGNEC
jgi:hypothetical protein